MKALLFSVIFLVFSLTSFAQREPIYNAEYPAVVPVWHRVADVSPQLRAVEAAEFSPDGRYAVSGSKFGYQVMLWRVADGSLVWERTHESEVECVVFSPDGRRIATGGEDYFVRIWDTETGEQLYAWEHDSGLDGITWSHDGQFIASGSEAGEAFLWDAKDYSLVGKVKVGSTINSLDFTKDDTKLVVAGNIQTPDPATGQTHYGGFASLIDVASQKVVQEYAGHTASIKSVRLSPDEQYIATGSFDSTARVYDVKSGKLIKTLKEPLRIEAVAFSPDGNYLLTGGHQLSVNFYRTSDFKVAFTLPTPRTEYIDFSSDGRLLLTAHEDSGLLSLFMLLSDTQGKQGFYQRVANEQLNNRDLKND
jgi:WD40 repeat protein